MGDSSDSFLTPFRFSSPPADISPTDSHTSFSTITNRAEELTGSSEFEQEALGAEQDISAFANLGAQAMSSEVPAMPGQTEVCYTPMDQPWIAAPSLPPAVPFSGVIGLAEGMADPNLLQAYYQTFPAAPDSSTNPVLVPHLPQPAYVQPSHPSMEFALHAASLRPLSQLTTISDHLARNLALNTQTLNLLLTKLPPGVQTRNTTVPIYSVNDRSFYPNMSELTVCVICQKELCQKKNKCIKGSALSGRMFLPYADGEAGIVSFDIEADRDIGDIYGIKLTLEERKYMPPEEVDSIFIYPGSDYTITGRIIHLHPIAVPMKVRLTDPEEIPPSASTPVSGSEPVSPPPATSTACVTTAATKKRKLAGTNEKNEPPTDPKKRKSLEYRKFDIRKGDYRLRIDIDHGDCMRTVATKWFRLGSETSTKKRTVEKGQESWNRGDTTTRDRRHSVERVLLVAEDVIVTRFLLPHSSDRTPLQRFFNTAIYTNVYNYSAKEMEQALNILLTKERPFTPNTSHDTLFHTIACTPIPPLCIAFYDRFISILLDENYVDFTIQALLAPNTYGQTPLHNAIYNTNLRFIQLLLTDSRLNNTRPLYVQHVTGTNSTILHSATGKKANLEVIKYLLETLEPRDVQYMMGVRSTIAGGCTPMSNVEYQWEKARKGEKRGSEKLERKLGEVVGLLRGWSGGG